MPPRKRPPSITAVATKGSSDLARHLGEFMHYLDAECGMSTNTRAAYRSDLVQFCGWYKQHVSLPVQQISIAQITRYLEFLTQRGLAPSTQARQLVSIKMYFRYLVLEEILPESVVELVNSPKLWKYLPKVLSPEKVDELLAAPTTDDRFRLRDRAVLGVLYATGCRASEVAGLKLSDVQLEEGYCRCLGKGNKERLVSLNPVARSALEAYLQRERPLLTQVNASEYVFATRRGNPLSRIDIWTLVKKYAARIGCSSVVSPHTLRHSFATHLLAGGAEIRALQELLGHASIATTQIYTQVEHSRLKAVHQKCHPRG